jgi:DNA repair photolyase
MPLRRVVNPPNPYVGSHCEHLGPPPEARIEVYEERSRSILASNDSPDIPFRWSINLYRGCQHACAYCYARPTHEYLGLGAGTDFDTKVTVKVNAPELLRRALSRRSWRRERIAFSGVTDCYQPLEAVYRLTRRCLEVCYDFANPVGIVTKAFLVVRDIELLARLNQRTSVQVLLSIPFADDATARLVEPHAPPPSRRFDAMRRLHDAGVPVGLMMAPLIPGLNDRDIPAVLKRAAACGARSASYQPLRLPGSVKDVFLSRLRERLPERAARIERFIRDMRGGNWNETRFFERMRGGGRYWKSVEQLFNNCAARFGIVRQQRYGGRCTTCAEDQPASRTSGQLPLFTASAPVRDNLWARYCTRVGLAPEVAGRV